MTVSIAQLSKLKARIPEIVNNSQDRQLTQLLEDAEQAWIIQIEVICYLLWSHYKEN